ncbi:MAG: polysulfide reductase NrfD [Peptococcaceae bacterium]|nr:polysulfide reductase NrfD [Peptococcaceae bacterium]
MQHWHWLIVIYLFLGGLGAGAYLTSFASEKGWLGKNSRLNRAGYFMAAPIVALGTLLLVFDLGQGLHKPWLLLRLVFNFRSVMTWGVYILTAFIIVGLITASLLFKKKKAPNGLTLVGAVLALATGAYTGLLLAVIRAVPFWNTFIMPILFVISALSTGLSLTTLAAHFLEKKGSSNPKENKVHLILVAAELIIAVIFFGIMSAGVKGPVASQSASLVMFGTYAFAFWGCFICLGLLLPLVVFVLEYLHCKKSGQKAVSESSLAGRETAAAVQIKQQSYLVLASDLGVLIGGFALRALIIFAALPIWDGKIL